MAALQKARYSTATEAVAEQLRRAITTGAFEPNSKLPTEKELVETMGVSRATVRESLRILEEQGLIIRRRGVGTFVRSHPILKNLNLNYGITNMIASAGYTPGTSRLVVREETGNSDAVESLRIEPGSEVIVVERVHTADGQPVVYSEDVLPASFLKGKREAREALDALGDGSLYRFFQTELDLTIHHGIAKLLLVRASEELCRYVPIRRGTPLLHLRQVDYLDEDLPLLLSHEYYIADAFEITVYRTGPGGIV